MENKNGYAYSKQWFDFLQVTKEMVTPMHTALYFWIVELNNLLHWIPVIGLPTDRAMQVSRIKSYKYYKKTLDDLIKWGFIDLKAKSYNQWTCNQITLILTTKTVSKQVTKQLPHNKTKIQTIKNNASEIVEKVYYNNPITNETR